MLIDLLECSKAIGLCPMSNKQIYTHNIKNTTKVKQPPDGSKTRNKPPDIVSGERSYIRTI